MVNGKPTLTFGDNPYATPVKDQGRTGGAKTHNAKIPGGFASYLPLAEYSAPAKTQQKSAVPVPPRAGAWADGGLRQPQPPATNAVDQGMLAQPAARSLLSPLAGYPGFSPAEAAIPSGRIEANQSPPRIPASIRRNALPPGGNSRVEARDHAQANMESFSGNRELGAPGMRLSRKSLPRIAGRPIPGRYDFGMEDTRKRVAERGVMSSRGESGHASPQADAMRARNFGMGQNVDRGHSRKTGRNQGGQSFITHGFGGGNAEQALRGLGYDMRESQPAATYARRLDADAGVAVDSDGIVFSGARSVSAARGEDGARTAVMAASRGKKPNSPIAASYPGGSLVHSFYAMADNGLGTLAAKFESGSEGISAIGFDRKGGTSYGKYQISSRAGTMAAFIEYLDEKAPDVAKRLRDAGPANTGGRSGRMPAEWRRIAAAEPARFEKLQEDFIRTSHFEPAMRSISESTGLGFSNMPAALREVLFSTAVQHGPFGAVRIFNQALNSVGVNKLQATGKDVTESFKRAGRQLIKQVYALRAGQFISSTSGVQAAVRNRLNQEMNEALGMLA